MDTKTLHDLLIDDGFNLKNYEPDECGDAITYWTSAIMSDPALLMDVWLEALEELHTRPKDDTNKRMETRRNRLLGHVGEAYSNLKRMTEGDNGTLTAMYATSWGFRTAEVGEAVVLQISGYVEKYVEDNGADWFVDVIGYAGDMEDDDGDFAYEAMKDRKLDERS
jgi:hypothetical protein